MNQTTKVIYTLKAMRQLLDRGIEPVKTMKNPLHEEYLCWLYELTPEVEQAINEVLGGMKCGS